MSIEIRKELSRDYQKYPLKRRIERPIKQDLEKLYFDFNWTLIEIGKFFNRTKRTIITWFHEYNIGKKSKLQILETRKRTNINKFGVDNPFKDKNRVK